MTDEEIIAFMSKREQFLRRNLKSALLAVSLFVNLFFLFGASLEYIHVHDARIRREGAIAGWDAAMTDGQRAQHKGAAPGDFKEYCITHALAKLDASDSPVSIETNAPPKPPGMP